MTVEMVSGLLKTRKKHTCLFLLLFMPAVFLNGSDSTDRTITAHIVGWAALFLVTAGVFIRVYSSVYIGGRKNETVVADGPFSIVRNPLYVGSFIAVAGIGLETRSIILGLLLVGMFLLYYPFVVRREERYLERTFGQAYRNYRLRTPRWIPDLSLWRTESETVCRPRFVLRALLEGSVFFLAIPLLDGIAFLHAQGWLPRLLSLP